MMGATGGAALTVEGSVRRRGLSVEAVEVALDTGLAVEEAEEALARLLCDAAGTYEVRGEGWKARVRYTFAEDFERRANARRTATRIARRAAPFFAAAAAAFRFCFGLFVLLSLVIVAVVTVVAVVALAYAHAQRGGSSSGSSWRGGGGGGGGGGAHHHLHRTSFASFGRGLGLFREGVRSWNEITLCYWCMGGTNPFFQPYYFSPYARGLGYAMRYQQRGADQEHRRRRRRRTRAVITDGVVRAVPIAEAEEVEHEPRGYENNDAAAVALVVRGDESSPVDVGEVRDDASVVAITAVIHAFVFGPVRSPEPSEAAMWRGVGAVCGAGCIMPEALAPLLPDPPTSWDAKACERAAARAVAHFGGTPVAADDGGVVFEFPDLVREGGEAVVDDGSDDNSVLAEARTPFAAIGEERCLVVLGLGLANLAGVAWLKSALRGGDVPEFPLSPLLHRSVPVLRFYAVLFLLIPALRALWLLVANRRVDGRNALRARWRDLLKEARHDPTSAIAAKLTFANHRALALRCS